MIARTIVALIAARKWLRDLKTGYHVSVYDCELDTWIRADCIGRGRFIVRHGNWELRTSTNTGYEACVEAEAWFKELKEIK